MAKLHEQINELKEAKEQAERELALILPLFEANLRKTDDLTAKVGELKLYDYRQFIPDGKYCGNCEFPPTGLCPRGIIKSELIFDDGQIVKHPNCQVPAKGENDG